MSGAEIAASLVPPRQFAGATLENYRPDPDYPSQAEAVAKVRAFVAAWSGSGGGLFSRRKAPETKPGLYLDGGFGVGKTHLLAALWKLAPGRKYFGTFIEYTALVGALGYAATVKLLKGASLLAIDEFELDDPGDTMIMSRLLGELTATGTRIAATSNTPPNALGEGRFAAIRLPARDPGAREPFRDRADRRARLPATRDRGARDAARARTSSTPP